MSSIFGGDGTFENSHPILEGVHRASMHLVAEMFTKCWQNHTLLFTVERKEMIIIFSHIVFFMCSQFSKSLISGRLI